ncbi:trk system potassium uptake protein TrkH [Metabacillus crassostreae]|uniref:TrkH family potassium uptake protein n=1 Tax=Metabacillus crassostreae TaxID=929098 RepID=UPI00195E7620|nr:TrkH family potassium uptake protein [Metabacillus crassostreae]MBM7605127.1 trk system potassium uptake protein TrkH [Metabacillus crassostreae]
MYKYYRNKTLKPSQFIIIGFLILIFIGTILLALPISSSTGKSIGIINALFTSTSAVCVTGLVVMNTGSDFSLIGQLIIMLLIQIGGLGFMTYGAFIALLLGEKIGERKRKLLKISTKALPSQSLKKLIVSIFILTILLESLATIILTIRWNNDMGFWNAFYHALFHSISAYNNAGFVLWSNSLSNYVGDPVVNVIISSLFIITGLGFTVLLDIYNNRRWTALTLHSKLVILMSSTLIIVGFIVILAIESINVLTLEGLPTDDRLWAAFFQSATTRTAGFNTINIGDMMIPSLLLIIFFMFIGASTGGTGGGTKTNTFFIIIIYLWSRIKRKKNIEVFEKNISIKIINRAITVIVLSFGVILAVTMLLTVTEHSSNTNFFAILFEATSAFGTVGLSMGLTPDLSAWGKIIITITMFIGRLGPLTLAYALSQKGGSKTKEYKSNEEDMVLIG